ncbi:MAG: O-antigen ligase family protein, partial [Chloroflexota bacterium]
MNKIAGGRFKRTPLDIFFALFLLTAAVGVWAAYDQEAAWAKFWLIAGAILIYYALAGQPQDRLWNVTGLLGVFAALLSITFLLTYDWQAHPTRIGLVNQVALRWMLIRPPLPTLNLDPDIVGGVIAILSPCLAATSLWAWLKSNKRFAVFNVVLVGIAMLGLFLTAQRGAWLGLGLAVSLSLLWLVIRHAGRYRRLVFASALGLVAAGVILASWAYPGLLLKVAAPGNRLETAQQTLKLAADFPFTGGGLGSFPGLFSRYILVIPWLFMPHASNLFLDTLVEQGVLGLMALAGIFLGSFWLLATRPPTREYWRWAAASGLIVMTVYGLVEDPFYSGWPVLLLFVFPGLSVAATEPEALTERRPLNGRWKLALGAGVLVAVAGMFVAFRQQVLAAWYANLGAVEMARVELAGWPETARWQSDFALAELEPAEALFNQALQLAPGNVTANYRLGLIAEKQGNETEAVARWSQANQATPSHRGVRKVLGYAYVWQGLLDRAAALLSDIP